MTDEDGVGWGDDEYWRTAAVLTPAASAAIDAVRADEGDLLLDVACGTGNVALAAAQRGVRSIGVNPSPRLLAQARKRAVAAGADASFVLGGARELPVESGAFDAAVTCSASSSLRTRARRRHRPAPRLQRVNLHVVLLCEHPRGASLLCRDPEKPRTVREAPDGTAHVRENDSGSAPPGLRLRRSHARPCALPAWGIPVIKAGENSVIAPTVHSHGCETLVVGAVVVSPRGCRVRAVPARAFIRLESPAPRSARPGMGAAYLMRERARRVRVARPPAGTCVPSRANSVVDALGSRHGDAPATPVVAGPLRRPPSPSPSGAVRRPSGFVGTPRGCGLGSCIAS